MSRNRNSVPTSIVAVKTNLPEARVKFSGTSSGEGGYGSPFCDIGTAPTNSEFRDLLPFHCQWKR
jgi:hypothetical protein